MRKHSKQRKTSRVRQSRTRSRTRSRTQSRRRLRQTRKQGGARKQLYANTKVMELTTSNFDKKDLNKLQNVPNTPGIAMMYADWCPHCNNEKTIEAWNKLASMVEAKNGYVAAMNCADDDNKPFAEHHGVNSYPTILFIKPDGTFYK